MVKLALKIKHEEAREKLILAAFVGFQMGAGGDKNFKQYLEAMGLASETYTPAPAGVTAEEAIKKAEGILKMAKKKSSNESGKAQ